MIIYKSLLIFIFESFFISILFLNLDSFLYQTHYFLVKKYYICKLYIMSNNTKLGLDSLPNDSGINNTSIGAYACYNNSNADNNTALGSNSAFRNTTGSNNTSLGTGSMCNNTTGSLNTAVGSSALEGPIGSVGDKNTAIGVQSLYVNQGSLNTAIGAYSALGVTGGNYNTFLGANTSTVSNLNYDYSTAIGYNAVIQSSNQIMIGGSNPSGFPNVIIPGNAFLPNFTTATNPYQIVPKFYVDTLAGGLVPTQACVCATTDNINLSSTSAPSAASTDDFDFSTQADGNYNVLVVNQGGSADTLTSNIQNGVYVLNKSGSTYTWSRPSAGQPMDVGFDAVAAFSFIQYGTTYSKTALVQINDPAIVGTDALKYQVLYQFNYQLGQGLNSTTVGQDTFINVDSSLNFIQFLDNTGGTLSLGGYSNATNIGQSSGTTTIVGALNVTGASTFNTSLPTSTQTPSSNSELTTKVYVDNAITTSRTNLLGSNNTWTGTNTFNSFLPTSTLTPSSGSQLTTKTYVDNAIASIPTSNLLTTNNTWTGTNTFTNSLSANAGLSVTGATEITTTGLGGTQTLTLLDSTSGNRMRFALNCTATNWNPIVETGDQVICAAPNNTGEVLTLTTNSSTNTSGVRITSTSVTLGAGGSSATPTASVSCSGTTVTVTGTATFNSSLPTSTQTPSSGSQLTTKTYVDSAVSTSTSNLLAANNTWTGTNTFNTSLPTSTQTPSSGSQLTTKTYVDSAVSTSTSNLLAANNTWTGTNTFSQLLTANSSLNVTGNMTLSNNINLNTGTNINYYDGSTLQFEIGTDGSDDGYYIKSRIDNSPVVIRSNSGVNNFIYYTGTTAGTAQLIISGSTSSTSFNTTSDYRIKENVEILNETYNVDNLRPVTYLNKQTNKQDIGLIAHEVQEVFPYLVNGEKDGEENQSVNYTALIPILIKEIQELKRELHEIKNKK